eukprot:758514-Amphidinium_carterae.1
MSSVRPKQNKDVNITCKNLHFSWAGRASGTRVMAWDSGFDIISRISGVVTFRSGAKRPHIYEVQAQ